MADYKKLPLTKRKLLAMRTPFEIDISVPFVLPFYALRGRLVRLQDVSTTIISQHDYPKPIAKILAEFLAAGATLAGLLKYEGVFTLQTKTSGPLSLAVIDVTHQGNLRGYVQFKADQITPEDSFQKLFDKGYLAFTVDQGIKDKRYQGIVTFNHETFPMALEHYFEQSEQLKTRICIFSKEEKGVWRSGALLLQELPSQKAEEDTWFTVDAILQTLSAEEFLDFSTPHATLLRRLFHEGGVTVYDPLSLQAKCRCTEERIKVFLNTLSPEEIESLLENGQLKITCEFCNYHYRFDRKDLMTVH